MEQPQQPLRPSGGPIVMFALLLLVIALMIGWAYLRNPSQTPSGKPAAAPTTSSPRS